jgi:hypothetical protein
MLNATRFEHKWLTACNRLARAIVSAAGCTMNINRAQYSFAVTGRGVMARLVPKSHLRDKLLVAFREDQAGALEAASELADEIGEEMIGHFDRSYGRNWSFYSVRTEPQDAGHISVVKRVMVKFLVDPQPRVAIAPPSLPGLIEQLKDTHALKAEGRKMGHCVERYALRVAERKSLIFRVLPGSLPEITRATLQLVPAKPPRHWHLKQLKGHGNGPVSPATRELVQSWLRRVREDPQVTQERLLASIMDECRRRPQ